MKNGDAISPKTWDELTTDEIGIVLVKSEQDIVEERVISQDALNVKIEDRFASEQGG